MTQKQQKFVRTELNIALGKKEGYMPSSLGVRSISVGRQAGSLAWPDHYNFYQALLLGYKHP